MNGIVQWKEDIECVEAFTTSLVIAEKFGKRHDHVLRKIDQLSMETRGLLKIGESSYVNDQNKEQRMYRLNRDAFAFVAMSFTGKRADEWKLKFIDAFNKMERQLRSMMKKNWLERRTEAALEYRAMSRIIKEVRAHEGKATKPHHYINEAKLVNWALTGEFASLNRDQLSKPDLKILCELQLHNAALIGANVPREQRKARLQARCRDFSLKLNHGEAA